MSCVRLLPVRKLRRTKLHSANTLVPEAATFFAGRGLAMALAVFVCRIADPVNLWVVADALVHGVHHNHLIPFVVTILANPIRVQKP